MTVQTHTTREPIGIRKRTKALAAGLLVAGMMSASMMTAAPAGAANTFTVNSTADEADISVSDGTCDADPGAALQCTLRAAIQTTNATPGADVIDFSIPGTGVQTIKVGATGNGALPAITEEVTINGYTQPGSSPNTLGKGTNAVLKIELDGTNAGSSSFGLDIEGTSNTVVKGLVVNRFALSGVVINRNSATGNSVTGNFIGTDPSGTIDLGNGQDGLVGTSGMGVIIFDASHNAIGGATPAERNIISGNEDSGLSIINGSANQVLGNLIGTDKKGTSPLGNAEGGVDILNSADNAVETNTIAFNGTAAGVNTFGSIDTINNRISRNSTFSNGGLGINLAGGTENASGATANDPGDTDLGPNTLQNFPVITSAKTVSGKTTVAAKLNSTPNKSFIVEFFSSPSGNEGKKFIGEKVVATNGSGNVSFAFSPAGSVPRGQTITATATGDRNGPGGTSEFSAPRKVAAS
jgi:CSLREA domain-containing protein